MPILEEISDAEDIDNMDMDLAEFDPNFKTPFAPKLEKTIVRSQDSEEPEPSFFPNMGDQPFENLTDQPGIRFQKYSEEEMEQLKSFQVVYPCYFDKNRSHKEGRRVPKDLAVSNPLAKTIADACNSLHLMSVYETGKTHPQDFGNPGRVRVAIKHDGKPESILVNNKRHLLNQIAKYLQQHETTLDSLKSMPTPQDFGPNFKQKEIPKVKGFKMNTIVPVISQFTLGHPIAESIYTERLPQPSEITPASTPKLPKTKKLHVRR